MVLLKRGLVALLCAVIFLPAFVGCRTTGSPVYQATANAVYLKNNIHVQHHDKSGEYRASYANWTNPGKGHIVIPVNTLVTMGDFRRGMTIIVQNTGKEILFELDESSVKMSPEQYFKLITSAEPTKLDRFSAVDQKGIKEGRAYNGMTKDGIRIALGYPAPHRTPSLGDNTWYYWTNRFRAIPIEFNAAGNVVNAGR
ncbi:MAG: outer membrane protein assembly factor BamE [Syntrophorhabdus sp.]|jgi:hypothetical protein|nr:outer membrane protein assembly factor BamE [Syntrophorhabdus sp.]